MNARSYWKQAQDTNTGDKITQVIQYKKKKKKKTVSVKILPKGFRTVTS